MANFLSAPEANSRYHINKFNCLGFAIGVEKLLHLYRPTDPDTGRPINPMDTPVKSFIKTLSKFSINVRQVESIEETDGKTAFWLWGWYKYYTWDGMRYDDFHVVRKNADGTFEHKPDGHRPASKVDLADVSAEYEETPYIFIVED